MTTFPSGEIKLTLSNLYTTADQKVAQEVQKELKKTDPDEAEALEAIKDNTL